MVKKSSYALVALAGLCLVNFATMGIIFNTSSLYLSPILEMHGFSTAAFTLTSTIQIIFVVIMLLVVGKIVPKIGVKNTLIIGSFCCVAMQLILSVAKTLPSFYLAYAVFGIGSGLMAFVPAPILINSWFAKRVGAMLGIPMAAMGLGGIVFSPITSKWIATVGYQQSYLNTAIVIAVACAIGCLLVKNRPDEGVSPLWSEPNENSTGTAMEVTGMTFAEARKTNNFYLLFVSALILQAVYLVTFMSLGLFLAAEIGIEIGVIGTVYMMYAIFNTIFTVPAGALTDKFGGKVVIASGVITFLICIFALLNAKLLSSGMFYLIGAILGYTLTTLAVPTQVIVRQAFGMRDFGSIMGVMGIPLSIGVAFLPIFTAVYDAFKTFTPAFIGVGILALFGLVIAFMIRTKQVESAVEMATTD